MQLTENRRTIAKRGDMLKRGDSYWWPNPNGMKYNDQDDVIIVHKDKVLTPAGYRLAAAIVGVILGLTVNNFLP